MRLFRKQVRLAKRMGIYAHKGGDQIQSVLTWLVVRWVCVFARLPSHSTSFLKMVHAVIALQKVSITNEDGIVSNYLIVGER